MNNKDTHPDKQPDPNTPAPPPPRRHQRMALGLLLVLPMIGLALVFASTTFGTLFWLGLALIASLALAVFYARHAHRMAFFEETLLAQTFLMAIIGIGLTNVSPQRSLRFWLALTVLMAAAALVIGSVRAVERKADGRKVLLTQLIHWGATFLTIGAVYQLFYAGRLNFENTGLVLLLVLGLSTFLDGFRMSWRFSLIGVLIGGTAIFAGFVERYIWQAMLLALALLAIVLAYEWLRRRDKKKPWRR